MTKYNGVNVFLICGLLMFCESALAAESTVPEPFREFDDSSQYAIKYDDFTALLRAVVVDVGRSSREVADSAQAKTGTRMRAKVKRLTANEGNRFYFETFSDGEKSRQFLRDILESLEQIPSQVPLENFSRDEQLAYWLNLYNLTVLNEIIAVYPKRNLKKLFRGTNSILEKKLLTVADVPLSLNDIQFTILNQNYDNNPLIMYGLYQGIVGGPDIRKVAYTGATVYDDLENNAKDFVNSNRGTSSRDARVFRVSSFYDRNRVYFPNFNSDLPEHLLLYLQGDERVELQTASAIKPDINDWTVTDLGGTHQKIGRSFADSRAALLDSVKSTNPDPNNPGGSLTAMVGAGNSYVAAKGRRLSRFDPELLAKLHIINEYRMLENERNSNVTIEDLEDTPVESSPDITADTDENE